MAILGGQAVGYRSFPSSSSSYFNAYSTATQCSTAALFMSHCRRIVARRIIVCSAVQESSPTATTATPGTEEKKAAPKAAAAKPKAAAKAPVKPLPQLMEEDVIPQLIEILKAQPDLSEIDITFQENRLDGSLVKNGVTYTFWAFFPTGDLIGPKGFSLSSYGSEASTVEPFLVDEKKITANLLIFWVEKRLAAQGIIPVWKE